MKKILILFLLTALVGCAESDTFVYDCTLRGTDINNMDKGDGSGKYLTVTGNKKDLFRDGAKFYVNTIEMTVNFTAGTIVIAEAKRKDSDEVLLRASIFESLNQILIIRPLNDKEESRRFYDCKFNFSQA